MTTYILLRDNKESTPLTLPDLRKLGLKPTDLVWVEGQSVCWLKPNQVQELKEIVSGTYQPENPSIKESEKLETKSSPGQKHIFVSLPHTELPVDSPHPEPAFQEPEPLPANQPEAVFPETKYSRPLDEIKEIYPENLKKQNRNWYEQIPPPVKQAAMYALLVISGLVAGLLINNRGNKEIPEIANQTESSATEIIPASNTDYYQDTAQVSSNESGLATDPNELAQQQKTTPQQPARNSREPVETTTLIGQDNADVSPASDPVLIPEENNTEEKEEKEKKKPSIKEIYSQIAVKSNDYTVGSFGGIKNLELTVSNHSKFVLDEVEIQVQYFKPMDELLKAETISIRSIPAGGKKTIPVKKTSRGVKVKLKVVGVESKDFMTNTAGI